MEYVLDDADSIPVKNVLFVGLVLEMVKIFRGGLFEQK